MIVYCNMYSNTDISLILSTLCMISVLSYFSFTENLFKTDNTKSKTVKNISYILLMIFLSYSITIIAKFSNQKYILNIILSLILLICLSYLNFGDNVFHEEIKHGNILNLTIDFGLIYTFIYIFLNSIKSQFSKNSFGNQSNDMWTKFGFGITFIAMYVMMILIAIGKVYHKDVSTIKKTFTTIGCTALFGSSIIIMNSLLKK